MRAVDLVAGLALVVACGDEPPPSEAPLRDKETALDVAEFHAMLATRETAFPIQSVRITSDGTGRARYVVALRASQKKAVVRAEFPGTLVEELVAAQVMYSAKPKDHEAFEGREKEVDALTFRAMLANPDEAARMERIRIQRTGDTARYHINVRTGPVPIAVYAEYPGTLVKAIEASKVPFTVGTR